MPRRKDIPHRADNDRTGFRAGRTPWAPLATTVPLAASFFIFLCAVAHGQSMPNIDYPAPEVGKTQALVKGRWGFSQVAMHRGRLIAVSQQDGGGGIGRLYMFDISDPKNPRVVEDAPQREATELQESHGWGFRGDTVVLQSKYGIQFWNVSPSVGAKPVSSLRLPDVDNQDYNNAIWWTHWQGRYLYAGGTDNGLYIVDALDPGAPAFVKRIPVRDLGGFRVGATHAVGNLLFISGFDNGPSGVSVLDISDPVNPRLLSTAREVSSYASMVNGYKLVLGARHRPVGGAFVYDVSDPSRLVRIGKPALDDSVGRGYVNFGDGFAFVGGMGGVSKFDMNKPGFPLVGHFTAGQEDEGFPMPLGNLLFAGNDHHFYTGHGSGLIVHQAGRDTLGPSVNMVVPFDGATRQAMTSRVGLTFTDQLDGTTLTPQTIVLREAGGDTVRTLIAHQTAIVNLHPVQPLKPNTTYEVLVRAGGVRDYAGNASPVPFRSVFTTGDRPDCRVVGPADSRVGDTLTFVLSCNGPVNARVGWDLGDGRELPFERGRDTVRVAFTRRGTFNVTARIEGELLGGSVLRHTTIYPVTPRRATNTTTLLRDEATGRLWNVNADNNSVTVLDPAARARLREIPVGRNPRTLALNGRRVWVANEDDATLTVIDADDFTVLRTVALPVASRPYGIVFEPGGAAGYVSLQAVGAVLRIDPAAFSISHTLPLFTAARGMAVSGDGARLYVTRYISGADKGTVAELRTEPFGFVRFIDLPYDNSFDSPSTGGGVPNAVAGVTITPDGRAAWVPFKKDNVRRGLQSKEPGRALPLGFANTVRTAVGQIRVEDGLEDAALRADLDNRGLANAVAFSGTGAWAFVTTGATNHTNILSGADGQNVTAVVPASGMGELGPDGLALTPDDSLLFVHYALSRQVGVYNVGEVGKSNQIRLLALLPTVGAERLPREVLRGKQVFHNAADTRMAKDGYLSCAVCHLDGGSDGRVWDFTHKGEGLRRTTSLRGRGGLGQGPLHWTANFDEVQDFEQDIRGEFGGTGFISDTDYRRAGRDASLGGAKTGLSADLDALSDYVSSLTAARPSPYRAPGGALTAEAAAGEAVFHRSDVGCAVCHAPPRYTNSGGGGRRGGLGYGAVPADLSAFTASSFLTGESFLLSDVGTITAASGKRLGGALRGFDTPTLLGVWEGGPYLHDGSAETLMDVLTVRNPQDRHGRTSHLSVREKEQLVAFLRELGPEDTTFVVRTGDGPSRPDARAGFVIQRQGARLEFTWPAPLEQAVLEIRDARGTRVARLMPTLGVAGATATGASASPGTPGVGGATVFRWSARAPGGARFVPGVFFARLTSIAGRHTQRFVVTAP